LVFVVCLTTPILFKNSSRSKFIAISFVKAAPKGLL
jgi:hypothetical protein